jgi:hypothetical protein
LIEAADYSCFDSSVKEKYVTHNAVLVGKDGDSFLVEVKGAPSQIKVPV